MSEVEFKGKIGCVLVTASFLFCAVLAIGIAIGWLLFGGGA